MRTLAVVSWSGVGVWLMTWVLVGCGEETCGPGTHEYLGLCVADSEGQSSPDDSVEGGDGTDGADQTSGSSVESGQEQQAGSSSDPGSRGCPGGDCSPSAREYADVLQGLREEGGECEPLEWDDRLSAMAQACSGFMAAESSAEGCDGTMDSRAADSQAVNNFETYAETQSSVATLDGLFDGIANHRANRFYARDCNLRAVGVGIAQDSAGRFWVTVTFGS